MDSVFCGRHICWIRTKAQSTINYSYLPRWRNWKYFITVVRCTLTKCWYAASAGSPVCCVNADAQAHPLIWVQMTRVCCILMRGGGGIWPPHSWPCPYHWIWGHVTRGMIGHVTRVRCPCRWSRSTPRSGCPPLPCRLSAAGTWRSRPQPVCNWRSSLCCCHCQYSAKCSFLTSYRILEAVGSQAKPPCV